MQFPVKDISGKQVSTVELPAEIFGIAREDINVGLMHQAYVRQMANMRLGTHKTKTRGEVRGTTAKMYAQKGTGRARHGARTAPIFRGGGRAWGPVPHKYTKDMPKKMYRAALRSALSAAILDEQVVIVDELSLKSGKTQDVAKVLTALAGNNSTLVLLAGPNQNLERGVGNLEYALYLRANYLNIRDLLMYDKVIVPLDALNVLTSWLGTEG